MKIFKITNYNKCNLDNSFLRNFTIQAVQLRKTAGGFFEGIRKDEKKHENLYQLVRHLTISIHGLLTSKKMCSLLYFCVYHLVYTKRYRRRNTM